MDFLNNNWTIGIVGSIVSGIVVFWITEKLFKKKINKELYQNIRLANSEIIYAIRPLVVDKTVPTQRTIAALRSSTAKKYELEVGTLMTSKEISEQLIKEILDNSFLSADNKLEYTNIIFEIQPDESLEKLSRMHGNLLEMELKNLRSRRESRTKEIAMSFAASATIVSSLIFIIINNKGKISGSYEGLLNNKSVEWFFIVPLVVVILTLNVFAVYRQKPKTLEKHIGKSSGNNTLEN